MCVKICSINASCNVQSETITTLQFGGKKSRRDRLKQKYPSSHKRRALKSNELEQIFAAIQSKASEKVEEAIRVVKQ